MSPNADINVQNLGENRTTEKRQTDRQTDRETDKMVMVLQGHPRSLILATIDNTGP